MRGYILAVAMVATWAVTVHAQPYSWTSTSSSTSWVYPAVPGNVPDGAYTMRVQIVNEQPPLNWPSQVVFNAGGQFSQTGTWSGTGWGTSASPVTLVDVSTTVTFQRSLGVNMRWASFRPAYLTADPVATITLTPAVPVVEVANYRRQGTSYVAGGTPGGGVTWGPWQPSSQQDIDILLAAPAQAVWLQVEITRVGGTPTAWRWRVGDEATVTENAYYLGNAVNSGQLWGYQGATAPTVPITWETATTTLTSYTAWQAVLQQYPGANQNWIHAVFSTQAGLFQSVTYKYGQNGSTTPPATFGGANGKGWVWKGTKQFPNATSGQTCTLGPPGTGQVPANYTGAVDYDSASTDPPDIVNGQPDPTKWVNGPGFGFAHQYVIRVENIPGTVLYYAHGQSQCTGHCCQCNCSECLTYAQLKEWGGTKLIDTLKESNTDLAKKLAGDEQGGRFESQQEHTIQVGGDAGLPNITVNKATPNYTPKSIPVWGHGAWETRAGQFFDKMRTSRTASQDGRIQLMWDWTAVGGLIGIEKIEFDENAALVTPLYEVVRPIIRSAIALIAWLYYAFWAIEQAAGWSS